MIEFLLFLILFGICGMFLFGLFAGFTVYKIDKDNFYQQGFEAGFSNGVNMGKMAHNEIRKVGNYIQTDLFIPVEVTVRRE